MTAKNETTITGEFDHTGGVYRLTVLIPLDVVIEQSTQFGGSTATTMLWIGNIITNRAQELMTEEHNERLSRQNDDSQPVG